MFQRNNTVALRVKWPSVLEMDASRKFLDGEHMLCPDFTDVDIQNAYYEGYQFEVEGTKSFVFNFYGEFIHAAINYPGSCHFSNISRLSGLMTKTLSDAVTPRGYAIIGDSAFVIRLYATGRKMVRSRKRNESHEIPTVDALAAVDIVLQRVLPS